MTTAVRLALACLVLVLLLGFGAWYYLFGPNKVDAAELLPASTPVFIAIPNAARIVTDYETSQLKAVVESPNAKPLLDGLSGVAGQKNLDLLQTLLPNLSGQSFLAFTQSAPGEDPLSHGEIIGLRPKAGAAHFDAFLDHLRSAYPGLSGDAKTGSGQVEGLDYQWIQPAAVSDLDRICIARHGGWIVIAWGEDTLKDWWERLQRKSTLPSLATDPAYLDSIARVGKNSEAILYLSRAAISHFLDRNTATTAETSTSVFNAFAVGSSFEHGEIVDHFSLLLPRSGQAALGLSAAPCPFDTLKFTGPDTRFYWAASFDWAQIWKNLLREQPPSAGAVFAAHLQSWAQAHNLDVQHNIIDALGGEISLQSEWSDDNTYPDVSFFLKIDHPDDFKPVTAAILDTVRQDYANRAVVNELNAGSQNFATLKFVAPVPFSPTITEDGPYLGIFLNETHAVRSFQRDESIGLLKNPDFLRQIGDRRAGATQITFLDSPRLSDRAYQVALPYLSLAGMFDRRIGALTQGRNLPPDLHWLAPIGTWSETVSADDQGLLGYSVSGIGNQGIFLLSALRFGLSLAPGLMQSYGSVVLPAPPPPPAPAVIAPDAIPAPNATTLPSPPSSVTNLAPAAPTSPAPANVPTPTPAPSE
jgi:hypothetical protein